MNSKVRRDYERAERCDQFSDSRTDDFPAGSKGAILAASVKERLATLTTLDVEKASSTGKRQQGTAGRRGTREELIELVEAVSKTGSAVAIERPETKGMFELPTRDHSDRTLIATARSFAERAEPLVGLFVEYGMAPTFINDLRSKADAMESYMSLQNEGVGTGVNVNASMRGHLRSLNETLEQLNVIYQNKYRDNAPVLAEWKSAYHLEAAPGTRRKNKSNGDSAPPKDNAPPAND